jgi:1-aminocyclopropane-1-carboxylate deaminase/D-cysteine desulfhydrase-like pyridoxal-dependent ACC family enzyme
VAVADRDVAAPGAQDPPLGAGDLDSVQRDVRAAADLHRRTRIVVRHEFFAGGYARSDAATQAAIDIAADELRLELEPTYTGKAMAALLHDAGRSRQRDASLMFWNTYNSNPLPEMQTAADMERLPAEFQSYFD